MQLFHYHLVTNRVREVEARYLAKLGFELVARYGLIGDENRAYESGVSWEELDQAGFRLRLTELVRGAVNVVVQPGQWDLPRVDHIGLVLDDDDFAATIERAEELGLRVREHGERRTFITTGAGYRVEIHPPRDWIDDLLEEGSLLSLAELQLKTDDPDEKAGALAAILDLPVHDGAVSVGETLVRFVPGGPSGRPELHGELFV